MLCICYENILSRTFIHAYINNDVKMTACQLAAVIELLHHHHTHTHTHTQTHTHKCLEPTANNIKFIPKETFSYA